MKEIIIKDEASIIKDIFSIVRKSNCSNRTYNKIVTYLNYLSSNKTKNQLKINNMKEITITVPDNCELKQDGNTYTIVEKEEVKVKVGYAFIAKELFRDKSGFYITDRGKIIHNDSFNFFTFVDENNCTSQKQAEKLLAINKLMNVAKYLNGDWQPDWSITNDEKYYIKIEDGKINIDYALITNHIDIYFKSRELAKQAIEILGKDTIKLALCTDY